MIEKIFWFPLLLQGFVIGFDEFYFHWKRSLPRWERIGHPLDTLGLISVISIPLFFPLTTTTQWVYLGLSLFSCLLITKDEWVHKEHCPASEQWLHALLFINHPLVLFIFWKMWSGNPFQHLVLKGFWISTLCFFFYQVVYWNFLKKEVSNGKS